MAQAVPDTDEAIPAEKPRYPSRRTGRDAFVLCGYAAFGTYLAFCGGLLWTRAWFLQADGSPVGADFFAFWSTARMVLGGEPLAAYDQIRLEAAYLAAIGRPSPGALTWSYPPTALLLTAPLGLLPFGLAWAAWLAGAIAAFVASLRPVLGRLAAPLALGTPATLACAVFGQNGFVTAALMAAALHLLDRRPWLAGLCLGALTYKPHFGLLFPLVLVATRRWRVVAGATLAALVLAAAAELALGPGAWAAFLETARGRTAPMVLSGVWDWRKLQSVYALAQALVGDGRLAMALHGAVALLACAAVLRLWVRPARPAVRAGALAAGAMLLPPYAFVYDGPVLTVAAAFLLRDALDRGFLRGERVLLAVAVVAPALQVLFAATALPAAAALLLGLALRRSGRPG